MPFYCSDKAPYFVYLPPNISQEDVAKLMAPPDEVEPAVEFKVDVANTESATKPEKSQ